MKKRMLSLLIALVMVVGLLPTVAFAATGYEGAALPAGPDMSGDVITVNAENAQYTLDGAYGSIDGKTIHFSESVSDILHLARPTKYQGSNTRYFKQGNVAEVEWCDDLRTALGVPGAPRYYRAISDVTFTAEEGVTLAGFKLSAGHQYGSGWDYVRDVAIQSTPISYYAYTSLNNVCFDGLTIKDNILFARSLHDSEKNGAFSGVTIKNCTFLGDVNKMADTSFVAIKTITEVPYYNSNITVTNCTITNYFQGIYIQGVDGVEIHNNLIDGTKHNAIALQNSTKPQTGETTPVKGNVNISENFIKNAADRAIRFGNVTGEAAVAINNNIMVDCGDSSGQNIKAGSIGEGAQFDLENNYWSGASPDVAVDAGMERPTTTGVVGGTFKEQVLPGHFADGYTAVDNGDGTYTVQEGNETPATPPAILPPILSPVIPTMPGLPFTDVADDAWYYDAVEYVHGEGLMNGVGGGKFNPTGEVTRGMVATILYRMEGSPRVYSDGAKWWSDARAWAMEEGISDGTNMEGKVTREQLAAMLYRYANFVGADTSARGSLSRFSDAASVSDWAADAMQWAVGKGVIGGSNGKLNPKGLATRAEVAAMFMRLDKTVG